MIFDSPPKNWKHLQKMVQQMFLEMNCHAEEEKRIDTVRGTFDADVYIVDSCKAPEMIYIIECKYWGTRVPMSVVREFRTVVSDIGAHLGIIVSMEGFQEGAYRVAENTNIKLFSWDDFNDYFLSRWLECMSINVESLTRKLIPFLDPDFSNLDFQKSESWDILRKWKALERRSGGYLYFVNSHPKIGLEDFPLQFIDNEVDLDKIKPEDCPSIFIHFETPRSYFNFMLEKVGSRLEDFKKLLGK